MEDQDGLHVYVVVLLLLLLLTLYRAIIWHYSSRPNGSTVNADVRCEPNVL